MAKRPLPGIEAVQAALLAEGDGGEPEARSTLDVPEPGEAADAAPEPPPGVPEPAEADAPAVLPSAEPIGVAPEGGWVGADLSEPSTWEDRRDEAETPEDAQGLFGRIKRLFSQ